MTNCRSCNEPIDFRDKKDGSGKYPVNTNGTFHNCRGKQAEQTSSKSKPESYYKRTRWEGIKKVEEVGINQVNEYLANGWIGVDNYTKVNLDGSTEYRIIVGVRA